VTWTKHPRFLLGPDGVMYPNAQQRDFRDPYVFWNADGQRYWMIFCSTGKTGVATSPNLEHWTLQPPLDSNYSGMGTPECPDAFRIGDTYYLIMSPIATSSTYARFAKALRGPYLDPISPAVDTRILYAAKRMFDGKRHILVGWIRDLADDRDGGAEQWGGTMCVPRELSAVSVPGRDRAAQVRCRSAHRPSGAAVSPAQVGGWASPGRSAGLGATNNNRGVWAQRVSLAASGQVASSRCFRASWRPRSPFPTLGAIEIGRLAPTIALEARLRPRPRTW
jgi:beta-fructofuranosidase